MLSLPLLPDVGSAIIDYLKNGRPKVESPYVFLRHLTPLEPFSDDDRLHQIVVKYMRLAQIPISPKKKEACIPYGTRLQADCFRRTRPCPLFPTYWDTSELYPDITATVEHAFGHVIPAMGGDDHETN